jgi:hypothetical protein
MAIGRTMKIGEVYKPEEYIEMFDISRRRNLIESGKYSEEEVDEHSEEWKSSDKNYRREYVWMAR